MSYMFNGATVFNRDIRIWIVSSVTDFTNMFNGATAMNGSTYNAPNTPDATWFTVSGYQFQNKAQLQTAVNLWISDNSSAAEAYGQINAWNTSLITDMSGLFTDKTTFNSDISEWDVSLVTNMNEMFKGASTFNQDIGGWDVTNVTNMSYMFYNATAFNQNIG